jgi:hypothetical protein
MVTDGNDVYSRREKIGVRQAPQAVLNTVGALFKGSHILSVFWRTYEYYQFDVNTSFGDVITVRIGTNGDVLGVTSEQAEAELHSVHETAKHPK